MIMEHVLSVEQEGEAQHRRIESRYLWEGVK